MDVLVTGSCRLRSALFQQHLNVSLNQPARLTWLLWHHNLGLKVRRYNELALHDTVSCIRWLQPCWIEINRDFRLAKYSPNSILKRFVPYDDW